MAIDKKINYNMQGNVKNYLGKQKMVKAPLHWQSAPNHPKTELAYITDAEKKLLIKKDLHKSLHGGVNRGPAGIMSLNGWGSKDDSGREVGMSGAATSAAESGKHTSDTLAAGLSNKDLQDYRSGFIAAGGGQNVNPGWFGPRNRVSRDELRAARAFAPGAYRATRGSGLGGLLRGALSIFGGIPGKVVSGLMTAKDWAGQQGSNLWSGAKDFTARDEEGNPLYPTWESFINRNKIQPVESIPTNQEIIGTRVGEDGGYYGAGSIYDQSTMPSNITANMGANNQIVPPNFLALGAKDGGRIGYKWGDLVEKLSWASPSGAAFNLGKKFASRSDPEEPAENIFEFMKDQGIEGGEMVSAPHPDEAWFGLWETLSEKGIVPIEIETLNDFKNWFHNQNMDMGSIDEQDQGIASLI